MSSTRIERIIDELIEREGGYVDDPDDPGGKTNHGITEAVARRHGYDGAISDMPVAFARRVYRAQYVEDPRFDDVGALSWPVAEELVDTGVNMGQADAGTFLQRCLNVFNLKAKLYRDLRIDGRVGDHTLAALQVFLECRGAEGEHVLLKALNCLQGADYIGLAEGGEKFETFVYGWLRARVDI